MTHEEIMQLGIDEARKTMNEDLGGPFGAVVMKGDEVVAVASNHVIAFNDPTAHAEVLAIREACKKLGTYDLSDCTLYATGTPCPMCLSAAIWANIKKIYFSGTTIDAEEIGFRDDFMYRFIEEGSHDNSVLELIPLDNTPARILYREYADMQKVIY